MTDSAQLPVGVVHYDLGPIGVEVGRLVAKRSRLLSVSAVDVRPELVGRPLSAVLGTDSADAQTVVTSDTTAALRSRGALVVAHCTGSSLARVMPQLLECINAGLCVVSTCEELSWASSVNN
jgi:hypothetical protein